MSDNSKNIFLRILALIFVIGLSVFLISIRDRIDHLSVYGYPGIFLVTMLSSATVLIPAPGLAIIFTMGAIFNPVGIAIAGGLGAGIGELSGYLAGFSGQPVIEKLGLYNRILPFIKKYGGVAVFILACIPNPVFDLVGIAAGMLKIPIKKFLIAATAGNTVKMFVFAYAGTFSIDLFFGN
ncbi:MAG: VTT domain-containing protein [Anaerolineales bacterium]|nr:VTT domain-containing protein [Anaerolineales bacterium]